MSYQMPRLNGFKGGECFDFSDGTSSKTFYSAGELDAEIGMYPIFNDQMEIVEYMDLMGTFSKDNTELGKKLYHYVLSERDVPIKRYGNGDYYYCGLVDFPSKFLADPKVRQFIQQEENRRYTKMCERQIFNSLLERLSYKHYIYQTWKRKMDKLEYLRCEQELNENINEKT